MNSDQLSDEQLLVFVGEIDAELFRDDMEKKEALLGSPT